MNTTEKEGVAADVPPTRVCELRGDPRENEDGERGEEEVVQERHVHPRLLRVEEDGEEDVPEDGDGEDVEHGHGDGPLGSSRRRFEHAEQVIPVDLIAECTSPGEEPQVVADCTAAARERRVQWRAVLEPQEGERADEAAEPGAWPRRV
eukprot:gene6903-biopygen5845